VQKLISWKHSFRKLNEEYEMALKKRRALNDLLNSGRISQPTYDTFDREIEEAIADNERQQKLLIEKMNVKAGELEEQIRTLEKLLANFEIQHVIGELNEDIYQREIELLSSGLEMAKHELDTVRDAMNQLSNYIPLKKDMETQPEENIETPQTEVPAEPVEEKTDAPIVEFVEVGEKNASQPPEETAQSAGETETPETKGEVEPEQTAQ